MARPPIDSNELNILVATALGFTEEMVIFHDPAVAAYRIASVPDFEAAKRANPAIEEVLRTKTPEVGPAEANGRITELTGVGTISGERYRIAIPVEADAVFLTNSAIRKFVVPYYASLWGAEATAAMLAAYENPTDRTNRFGMYHTPPSRQFAITSTERIK